MDPRLHPAWVKRGSGLSWRFSGPCSTGDAAKLFPDREGDLNGFAERFCRYCPVAPECLAWALDTEADHGVWGGTTPYERSPMAYLWARAVERAT